MAKRKIIPQQEFMNQFSKEAIAEDMICNLSGNSFKDVAQMDLNFLEGDKGVAAKKEDNKEEEK